MICRSEWTTEAISDLVKPLNWPACRTIYPGAAALFICALNEQRTPIKSLEYEAAIKRGRADIQKVEDAIKTLQTYIGKADRSTRQNLFSPVEQYHRHLHDHPDLQGKLPYFHFQSYIDELEVGIAAEARKFVKKRRSRPRNNRAHHICDRLALIYALFTGEKPTCNKPKPPSYSWGEYGDLLVRVLEGAGERIADPEAMSRKYCAELSKEQIVKLQITQKVYLYDDGTNVLFSQALASSIFQKMGEKEVK